MKTGMGRGIKGGMRNRLEWRKYGARFLSFIPSCLLAADERAAAPSSEE